MEHRKLYMDARSGILLMEYPSAVNKALFEFKQEYKNTEFELSLIVLEDGRECILIDLIDPLKRELFG